MATKARNRERNRCPICGSKKIIILDELPIYKPQVWHKGNPGCWSGLEINHNKTAYYRNCLDCDEDWASWNRIKDLYDEIRRV